MKSATAPKGSPALKAPKWSSQSHRPQDGGHIIKPAPNIYAEFRQEQELRRAITEMYCQAVCDSMIEQITAFALDPVFDSLAHELAGHLGIRASEAAELLLPTCKAIEAAVEASCA